MNGQAILPSFVQEIVEEPSIAASVRKPYRGGASVALRASVYDDAGSSHQAELFYLQKQIQSQTPMVIVMEDGEVIEGCIEWYDRNALKVRGRSRMLVYKAAIKYMYKQGESGL